jgi:long-chain acyl-CoA synthetase
VEAYGKANLVEPIPAYPDLVASICYTSVSIVPALVSINLFISSREQPTTPKVYSFPIQSLYPHSIMPKGVVLKHKNLALATQSNMYGMELPEDVVLLSYLPLAHIYEVSCWVLFPEGCLN